MPNEHHRQFGFTDTDADHRTEQELSRRDFLRGIGVTLASATTLLSGCARAPNETIVPYLVQPEDVHVGLASHYATAMTTDGYATGLVVTSHEGRPTKIEGNPRHPASLGACGVREQASIMELFSPRRQHTPSRNGRSVDTPTLDAALRSIGASATRERGLHVVLPPTGSPLLIARLHELRTRLPEARVHYHTPLSRMNAWQGAQQALGAVLEQHVDLRRANVILAIDADFLGNGPAQLVHARHFADRRRVLRSGDDMNRLYVIEAALSSTGQVADHRLAARDSELPGLVARLLLEVTRELGETTPDPLTAQRATLDHVTSSQQEHIRFVRAVARDLIANRQASAVLVGDRQPACIHAAAHALNELLGNVDTVISYTASPIERAGDVDHDSLLELSLALEAKSVETLIVFDTELAESSPAELALSARLRNVSNSFYFGQFSNATAQACQWCAPLAHWLESWGDTRALDGTVSIVQPLVAPLHAGRTVVEVLSLLLGEVNPSTYALLRERWRPQHSMDLDPEWERALAHGVVPGTQLAKLTSPVINWGWLTRLIEMAAQAPPALELCLYADPRILDGRFGNNPWLVELPEPVTKLTWSNAALLAPETAARFGIQTGDVVALSVGHTTREVPALLVNGQAQNAIAVSLGWGRHGTLSARGLNGFDFSTVTEPHTRAVTLQRTNRRETLAITQEHRSVDGIADSVVAYATLHEYRTQPDFTKARRKRQLSLYSTHLPQAVRQWGMSIDLNACIGCGACVIACQAENNIPTVGRDGVLAHREMHWLRIDRYVLDNSTVVLEPMACQHCEQAPCEYVCPTAATVHSSDGLNQMVYNRCVGTRFCSNNCPYKVRRFNWFNYHADETEPPLLAHNPEVTVRGRGVMEKCTYCVQRIRTLEIRSRIHGQPIADGELQTACQQTCPTQAIVFGDIAERSSRVAQLRDNERGFDVLHELGTTPRTRYLAKLTNPNPELG